MTESVRIFVRYELNKERKILNKQFDIYTPDFEIPKDCLYLWHWFIDIINWVYRIDFNGYYYHIPPSEFLAWCKFTDNDVSSLELDMLKSMDFVFCEEMNKEIKAKREKEDFIRKQKLELKNKKRK